jgi:5-hydroxyisourate hydrolase-like protein (transthyretin family)
MKRIVTTLGLLAAMTLPAIAADTGGVAGYVVDLASGQPVNHAAVAIYRMPLATNAPIIESATTDSHGFFANIHVMPGRYLVTADVANRTSSCIVDDVFPGQTIRMKIEVGADGQRCIGPKVHSAVVNPNETADVYRIR